MNKEWSLWSAANYRSSVPVPLLHTTTSPLRINAYRPRPAMVDDKPPGG